jgi:hypothetical protein
MINTIPPFAQQPKNEDLESEIIVRANKGFELMVEIAGGPIPADMQDRIYRYACNAAVDPRYDVFECKPHWVEVLMVLSKGKEKEILPILDQLLKDKRIQTFEWIISRIAIMKIDLLRRLGRGGEVYQLVTEHPDARALRDLLIREALEVSDYKAAKRLAEEGMNSARNGNHPVSYSHFRETLHALAQQFNDAEDIRRSAREYYNETKDLKYYRLIKGTYTPKDWPAAVEKAFIAPLEKMIATNVYSGNPSELAAIYMEEQDWPRLLKLLQRRPIFGLVELYTDMLLPLLPAEMLALYYQVLLEYASVNKHADAIGRIFSTLTKMKEWKGGREVVNLLVAEFKVKFSTRSKLLEVISRV